MGAPGVYYGWSRVPFRVRASAALIVATSGLAPVPEALVSHRRPDVAPTYEAAVPRLDVGTTLKHGLMIAPAFRDPRIAARVSDRGESIATFWIAPSPRRQVARFPLAVLAGSPPQSTPEALVSFRRPDVAPAVFEVERLAVGTTLKHGLLIAPTFRDPRLVVAVARDRESLATHWPRSATVFDRRPFPLGALAAAPPVAFPSALAGRRTDVATGYSVPTLPVGRMDELRVLVYDGTEPAPFVLIARRRPDLATKPGPTSYVTQTRELPPALFAAEVPPTPAEPAIVAHRREDLALRVRALAFATQSTRPLPIVAPAAPIDEVLARRRPDLAVEYAAHVRTMAVGTTLKSGLLIAPIGSPTGSTPVALLKRRPDVTPLYIVPTLPVPKLDELRVLVYDGTEPAPFVLIARRKPDLATELKPAPFTTRARALPPALFAAEVPPTPAEPAIVAHRREDLSARSRALAFATQSTRPLPIVAPATPAQAFFSRRPDAALSYVVPSLPVPELDELRVLVYDGTEPAPFALMFRRKLDRALRWPAPEVRTSERPAATFLVAPAAAPTLELAGLVRHEVFRYDHGDHGRRQHARFPLAVLAPTVTTSRPPRSQMIDATHRAEIGDATHRAEIIDANDAEIGDV